MVLPPTYKKVRARIEELYPGMSDKRASLIITNGQNGDLIRAMKRGRSSIPRGDNLKALLSFLQVNPSWFLTEEEVKEAEAVAHAAPANAIVGEEVTQAGPNIPLYGSAVGGIHGEFELNGSFLGHVTGPVSLKLIRGAYAVIVQGESMFPRYEDGETVFVNPHKRVKRGDYVVVQIQLEEAGPKLAYVKRFESRNAEELVLSQLNPLDTLRFKESTVVSVHYILKGGE